MESLNRKKKFLETQVGHMKLKWIHLQEDCEFACFLKFCSFNEGNFSCSVVALACVSPETPCESNYSWPLHRFAKPLGWSKLR